MLRTVRTAYVATALLAVTACVARCAANRTTTAAVYYAVADDRDGVSVRLTADSDGRRVGEAICTGGMNATGWDYLEIHTSHKEDDSLQAYAAGFLEGWITADSINIHWHNIFQNFCDDRADLCVELSEYLQTNMNWVMSQVAEKNRTDAYWYQVGLIFKQLDGLYDGYKMNSKEIQTLTRENLFWMNIQGDLYNLCDAFNSSQPHQKPFGIGSNSVLIKLLPSRKGLLFSHVTSNWYETMSRIQKRYRLKFKESKSSNQLVFGHDITFSSYPGLLYSSDDFYLISSGLAVTRTTISVHNPELWTYVQPIGQVFVFIRAMVANRLAADGLAWTKLFKKHNSGTFNSQWLVINYSLFRPGRKIPRYGLLHILEQMPGLVETLDITEHFKNQTYWASYNVPLFPAIYEMSGQGDMVERYGNWFSYQDAPRARIFDRDHADVTDVLSMLLLMRSNDFRNDPESRCASCVPPYSAENAISSRDDLNDRNGVYPFEALGYSNFGAIDAKVTNHEMAKELKFLAVSGPTHGTGDCLGTYCWSKSRADNIRHAGLPDCWDFKPVIHVWDSKHPAIAAGRYSWHKP